MELSRTAAILAQLGAEPRLKIFRILVRGADDGLTVGDLQRLTGMPASTLAFHLRGLVDVGLVRQEKVGRSVVCRPNPELLQQAVAFLTTECCIGFDASEGRAA